MFLLQTFHPSNPGGSQEHVSLITNTFFNDVAFIIKFQHKGYLNSFLLYDWPFFACALSGRKHYFPL